MKEKKDEIVQDDQSLTEQAQHKAEDVSEKVKEKANDVSEYVGEKKDELTQDDKQTQNNQP